MDYRPKSPSFPSTRWSVVASAGDAQDSGSQAALEELCQIYWYPLYAFLRRQSYSSADAEDLTQAFFAKLLSSNILASADPERGKLRSYLLTVFKRFLGDQNDKAMALKRGGHHQIISIDAAEADQLYAQEPANPVAPDALYERRWALTVLETVIGSLRNEFSLSGREELFDTLEPYLAGAPSANDYTAAAEKLEMKEATVRVAVFRLRRRYGQLLRDYIADTVAAPEDVAEELEHLMQSLSV